MLSNNERYQNIISQIHELNRQNLLIENEKNEYILSKINNLENLLNNNSNTNNTFGFSSDIVKKSFFVIVILLTINILLSIMILFSDNGTTTQIQTQEEIIQPIQQPIGTDDPKEQQIIQTKTKDETITDEKQETNEDVVSFDNELTSQNEEENYEDIKPIIKKDTIYSCEDDGYISKQKIPYTVEIKGKLYKDFFVFIKKETTGTTTCRINKDQI